MINLNRRSQIFGRWAISDMNPWIAALGPAASQIHGNVLAIDADAACPAPTAAASVREEAFARKLLERMGAAEGMHA